MRGTLVVFVKAPQAGRVKSRLARALGSGRAASIYRHLTALTLAEAEHAGVRVVLAVDPPSSVQGWNCAWPPSIPRVAQARGDLGERLRAVLASAPPGPVVVIGSDAPRVRARHILEAFRALARADAVFGPAEDGGFWLVGLANARRTARLFQGVRWSSPHALEDARASLPKGFSVARLETLRDVDEAEDLVASGPITRSRRAFF